VVRLHRALDPGKVRPLVARMELSRLTGLMRSAAEAPSLTEAQHPLERVRGNQCLFRLRPG
jgi:hypothetical protein